VLAFAFSPTYWNSDRFEQHTQKLNVTSDWSERRYARFYRLSFSPTLYFRQELLKFEFSIRFHRTKTAPPPILLQTDEKTFRHVLMVGFFP
jgi:hypothetical protein